MATVRTRTRSATSNSGIIPPMSSSKRCWWLLFIVGGMLLASCGNGATPEYQPPSRVASNLNTAIQAGGKYYDTNYSFSGIGIPRRPGSYISSIQQMNTRLHFKTLGYSDAFDVVLFRPFVKRDIGSGLLLAVYAPQQGRCWYALMNHAFGRLDGPTSPATVGIWYTSISTPASGCTIAKACTVSKGSWVMNLAVGQTSS